MKWYNDKWFVSVLVVTALVVVVGIALNLPIIVGLWSLVISGYVIFKQSRPQQYTPKRPPTSTRKVSHIMIDDSQPNLDKWVE